MNFTHCHIIVLLTALFLMYTHPSSAQHVTVSGSEPDYAGRVLGFYSTDNYFCNSEIKLGEFTVAANGWFSASFLCKNARLVYIYLGVFKVRFYVEPGFSYEVKLPPRTDKTPEEAESPFFQEVTVLMNFLSIKDDKGQNVPVNEELNFLIAKFDETFNPLYDQMAIDVATRRPVAPLDSTIRCFRENLPNTGNYYFDQYAFYRSGLLYYAARRSGMKYLSNSYFAQKPVLYDNEAYMELFNTTYDKYFMYFGNNNDAIYEVVNQRASFSELKRLLAKDRVLPTDSLCELVILKNVYDEFYADRFSRGALLHLLDSAMVQTKIERYRELASEIRTKVTKLLPGFEPPAIELFNHDSTLVSLQHYRGKYVYLMFCTTQNYVCLSQYELLEKLYRSHHQWLQIVIISVDERLSDMRYFREKNGYKWDFLHFANDPDVLEKYDVRIFPTCYLINPEGKLVLSPAPAANEQLELTLWRELNPKGLWQEYLRKGWIILD